MRLPNLPIPSSGKTPLEKPRGNVLRDVEPNLGAGWAWGRLFQSGMFARSLIVEEEVLCNYQGGPSRFSAPRLEVTDLACWLFFVLTGGS